MNAPASRPAGTSYRREAFVLAVATGLIGMTFGVFADTAGLDVWKASAMSILVFTGASQFAAVSVLEGGGSPASAIGSALLLGARNSLYGPVVADSVATGSKPRDALTSQFVIDETTAMASTQSTPDAARDAFWFTGLWLFALWNVGTVIGVILGNAIGDPEAWGLDAAFPAGFVALIVPHVRTRPKQVTALVGAAIAILAIPTTRAGVPMLLAALAVLPGLWLRSRWKATP